jgi:hypothetical protein
MVKGLSLLTLALVGIAGLAQAQTATGSGSPPLDPQGRVIPNTLGLALR